MSDFNEALRRFDSPEKSIWGQIVEKAEWGAESGAAMGGLATLPAGGAGALPGALVGGGFGGLLGLGMGIGNEIDRFIHSGDDDDFQPIPLPDPRAPAPGPVDVKPDDALAVDALYNS